IGAVLQEQEDEWRVQRRYLSMQSMAKLAVTRSETEAALVLDACARKRACSRREPPFTHLTGHDRRWKDSGLFEELFDHVVKQAIDAGYIDGRMIFTDSSHLKANANKRRIAKEGT